MPDTYVRIRLSNGDYRIVPAIAGIRHESGETFLVHAKPERSNYWTAFHARTGLAAISEETISDLIRRVSLISSVTLKRVVEIQTGDHFPELNPPGGFEHAEVWRQVEASRFANGTYKPVPLLPSLSDVTFPSEHFLHLSVTETETDYVAYTPSEDYGKLDRQVRLRFGRYLKKTFPTLSDATIQAANVELRAALKRSVETLHFATDRETINEIFETKLTACGGSEPSCMYGKWGDLNVRPYHVYADSPDVAVAYLRRGDAILARSIVSTSDKRWVRAYAFDGDEALCKILTDMLAAEGYKKGSLDGNRLTRLPGRVRLPYLDGDAQDVNDEGTYWRVVYRGEYTADQTDGTATANAERCDDCNEPEDDCSCSYCECCEQRYVDGCDHCNICSNCDCCATHGECDCNRCAECNALMENCDCERCSDCTALLTECECETETETETTTA